jgi:zinc protease
MIKKYIVVICCFINFTVFSEDVTLITTPEEGIKIGLIEKHTVPVIQIVFKFANGLCAEPPEQHGIISTICTHLFSCTPSKSHEEYETILKDNLIHFGLSSDDDETTLTVFCKTDSLDVAQELLKETLISSLYSGPELFALSKKSNLEHYSNYQEMLRGKISLAIPRILFSAHPYEVTHHFSPHSSNNITIESCRDFLKRLLTKDTLVVGVIGDINVERVSNFVDDVASLFNDASEFIKPAVIEPKCDGKIYYLNDPTSQQASVSFHQQGLSRHHDDYCAYVILNHLIGMHLHNKMRDKGLVYSIDTSFESTGCCYYISGNYETENQKLTTTINTIRSIWQSLKDNGPDEEEFDFAKSNLIGSMKLSEDGNFLHKANYIATILQENIPIDYLTTCFEKYEAVTYGDVVRVAQTYLDPENLTFFVEGNVDFEGLEYEIIPEEYYKLP